MQATASTPAAAPDAGPAPQPAQTPRPAPAPREATIGGTRVEVQPPAPLTGEEVASLRARREELSDQLISATNRRDKLAEQLPAAQGAARVGLEQRIILLDQRILQLEQDIAETGRQLTSAPAGLRTEATVAGMPLGMSTGQVTGISIVFILAVLLPLAVAMGIRFLRRPFAPPPSPALDILAQRMERVENAIDAVAVEIERVSEGQRWVARVLSERGPVPALGVGQAPAEPIRVPDEGAVRVPRHGSSS